MHEGRDRNPDAFVKREVTDGYIGYGKFARRGPVKSWVWSRVPVNPNTGIVPQIFEGSMARQVREIGVATGHVPNSFLNDVHRARQCLARSSPIKRPPSTLTSSGCWPNKASAAGTGISHLDHG